MSTLVAGCAGVALAFSALTSVQVILDGGVGKNGSTVAVSFRRAVLFAATGYRGYENEAVIVLPCSVVLFCLFPHVPVVALSSLCLLSLVSVVYLSLSSCSVVGC